MKTLPIVVRLPDVLALTQEQVDTLETKWQADLVKLAGAESKIKWNIKIQIEVGSG